MSFPANTNAKIIKQDNQSKLTHVYNLIIPYETFTKWAEENRKLKNINGFRQGHVPLSYLKDDWALACIRKIADEIIKNENFQNIYDSNYMLIKFELGHDIELRLNIELMPQMPEIELEKIKLTKHVANIEEEHINKAIEEFKKRNFKPIELSEERASQMGDFLNVSIEINDQQGKKENVNDMEIHLGYNTFLPEIEQKLIGLHLNETLEHDFTIPEHGTMIKDSSLAGKKVKLLFKINKIQGEKNFEQEDMFFHFQVNSESELKEKFEIEMQKDATKHSQFLLKENLKQELLQHYFEVPIHMLQSKYAQVRQQMLKEMGHDESEEIANIVKEKMNLEIEEFEKRCVFIAEAMLRLNFVIGYFRQKMGIEISNSEIEDAIIAQKNAFPQGLQEAMKFFAENSKEREALKNSLIENKLLLTMATKCSVETKNHKLEDFYNVTLQKNNSSQEEEEKLNISTDGKKDEVK